jgi:hypothetical protein
MKFEINEQVLNNLKAFLNRVDLKGTEVGAFCEVINVLSTPIKDDIENKNNIPNK